MSGEHPTKQWPKSDVYWPKTLKEAVDFLYDMLPDSDLVDIAHKSGGGLYQLHHGLGADIRNNFGLLAGNTSLRKSCYESHPDSCSMVIIRALRDKARAEGYGK